MIEKIYIPTLGRVNNQKTYNNLPEKWQKKTYLVVQYQEYAEYDKSYNLIRLPKEISGEFGRISNARSYISKELGENCRYGVFDDDLDFVCTEMPLSGEKSSNRPMTVEDYDLLFEKIIPNWMDDGYFHIGQEPTSNIPREIDFQDNFRITAAVYYDGENLCRSKVDWKELYNLDGAEDFDCNLQLLRSGFPNRVSARYRISTGIIQSEGGCSLNRTVATHNEAMRILQQKHIPFVRLYEKDNKMDFDDTVKKLGAKISWKEAYKSSEISTLENFFEEDEG